LLKVEIVPLSIVRQLVRAAAWHSIVDGKKRKKEKTLLYLRWDCSPAPACASSLVFGGIIHCSAVSMEMRYSPRIRRQSRGE
jgi:hypothetical protein